MVNFVPTAVSYLNHMGSDKTVVDAARVSFAKYGELGFGQGDPNAPDASLIRYLANGMTAKTRDTLLERIADCDDLVEAETILNDVRRIAEHWTPFGHCMVTFHVRAPIFVHRQITRSGVGLRSHEAAADDTCINEESRRYVSNEPYFYKPRSWRAAATDKKQGSGGAVGPQAQEHMNAMLQVNTLDTLHRYTTAVEMGVAPEQARMFLPLNTMTEWVWTGSLYAWSRVCKLRIASDAQEETREVALRIVDHLDRLFPLSAGALVPSSWRA